MTALIFDRKTILISSHVSIHLWLVTQVLLDGLQIQFRQHETQVQFERTIKPTSKISFNTCSTELSL